MPIEHSRARQERAQTLGEGHIQGLPMDEASPAANLLIGAEAIALYVHGKTGRKERRDIYRNVFGFSFFKHGNAVCALKSTINAELAEKQRVAQEERRKKGTTRRTVVNPGIDHEENRDGNRDECRDVIFEPARLSRF
jgi:hypothetical protein